MRYLLLFLLVAQVLAAPANLYGFSVKSLAGQEVPLKNYQGKVVLLVNVASQCGFTSQYEGLEKLYRKHSAAGLVVLGFPCNDFGGQEPGSNSEIKTFCSQRFQVSFPLFDKVKVKAGPEQSPLYQWLGQSGKLPSWNFGKYLIDRQGKVVKFFGSSQSPESIEAELLPLLTP